MDHAREQRQDNARLAAQLQALEAALQSRAVRADSARLAALLADEFVEFGSSGKLWTRAATLADLPAEDFCPRSISDFQARLLAEDVALVTYRSQRHASGALPASASLRSSLWKWRDGRWQMIFHQGTPIPG
ncbi:nuclear transport factor 2 family protein [Janthinobacterium sp. SUN176]|uniref:nuclear transport factor 2 family protein n=1 Tax=Janthinobacterium sp. SUN176 TaxID=3014788 RepID=UPI0027131B1D|nr:nuclear transport factor 2 family protein [Janthinobacterium sp. SUN176]MDO8071865.1 nuclear transport factor 2 family protein [Janthinobacterium sp. SUN176]